MSRPWLLPLAFLLLVAGLPARPGVAAKLADDGRAGAVLDVQGVALVQPAGHDRWTPLGPRSVLYPGDLVRTRARGAHALEVQTGGGRVLLGPGTEAQVQGPGELRLLRGELEAVGHPDHVLALQAPGAWARRVAGTVWLRARDRQTRVLEHEPRWVHGYHASASEEWMGSLLANVDGRDVPLAVGTHKVSVEIRDQIARTTIEESFVNSTDATLEGVFHFPLPADASISGFGMWIGGELVEADIVERQRARQIYEQLLRQRKDPGLLEWEGGNVFQARVFPIPAHGEKRIRLRYTQVLPLEGDTYRYRYALRSELLRTKPLRELQIAVRVVSRVPLRAVGSPTHEVVVHQAANTATAEFRASEYRPERDFELDVRVDRAADVVAIPHRRGEDGYFMLMLAPPDAAAAGWKRELTPEGDPLDVLVLADTSGSMGPGARAHQAAFLDALLGQLGTKDRFRLAAFDTDVDWIVRQPTEPTDDSVGTALAELGARRSLGWTDLDRAFAAVLKEAGPHTLVVYVGDGVPTTGDADPVAEAERLRALAATTKASVHAVAASSSYEAPVLEAMARIGGGSMRRVGSHPAASAFALLAEAARPAVKDLAVSIEGLRTARVYPRHLPNLPLGFQQIVLGRYLPTGAPQTGRVVVTGTLAGKPVRYATTLQVGTGDEENSFLPRLWARRHIEALRREGASPEIRDEIVSFSERFGIMTPYTSFLVLENDEQRAQFGVQRRVRMRDGERFFADARDRAKLEKKRDLMRAAGRWRRDVRRRVLLEIARLGRDLPIRAPTPPPGLEIALGEAPADVGPVFGARVPGLADHGEHARSPVVRQWSPVLAELGLRDTGVDFRGLGGSSPDERIGFSDGYAATRTASRARGPLFGAEEEDASKAGPPPAASPMPALKSEGLEKAAAPQAGGDAGAEPAAESPPAEADSLEELDLGTGGGARLNRGRRYRPMTDFVPPGLREPSDPLAPRPRPAPQFTLQSLGFPALPPAPRAHGDEGDVPPWDPAVAGLLHALPRRAAVRSAPGGLHFVIRREVLHPTRGRVRGADVLEAWIGADAWRVRRAGDGFSEPAVAWVHDGTRGALAAARRLARTRKAGATDADAWSLPLWDLRTRDVLRAWRRAGWRATLESRTPQRAVVRLARARPHTPVLRLEIDPARRVILAARWFGIDGKQVRQVVRSDFVQVAGRWWARTIGTRDEQDRLVARRRVAVEALTPADLAKALGPQATENQDDVLVVHGPLPTRVEAKQAAAERRATFTDELVLALDLGQQERAAKSLEAWGRAEALGKDKPGTRWVRTVFLARMRRGESFKGWLQQLAPAAASAGGARGRFLAAWLHAQGSGVLGPHEEMDLLQTLRASWVDAKAPLADLRGLAWQRLRLSALEREGHVQQARDLRTALAKTWPFDVDLQLAHEDDLWKTGQAQAALALLAGLVKEREPWRASERGRLYTRWTDRLWSRRRLQDLGDVLDAWLATKPRDPEARRRRLSTFYLLAQEAQGDTAVKALLDLRLTDRDPDARWADQQAAVEVALGSGWAFSFGAVEPVWRASLAALCHHLVRLPSRRATPAQRILNDWGFRRTDTGRKLRDALYADLDAPDAVRTWPVAVLERYVRWLAWGRGATDEARWRHLVDGLLARWRASGDVHERVALAGLVLHLFDAHGVREEALAFARERLGRALGTHDPAVHARAADLFRRLLQTPDRDEHANAQRESECLGLLAALADPAAPRDQRRATLARAVRQLAARFEGWRTQAALGSPAEREKLSRAALRARQRSVREQVRGALARRLGAADTTAPELARPWLRLERLAFAVQAGQALDAIAQEAQEILAGPWTDPEDPLDRLQRERAAVILAYAATRSNADASLVAGVRALFERGAQAATAARAKDPAHVALLDWRYQLWRLLVARDEPDALQKLLGSWIVPAHVESRWRIALAYLDAERGDLRPAVAQLEAVQALDELRPSDYAALADWYLVLGDDARREAALDARLEHMDEGQLSNLLWRLGARLRPGPGGVPADFDPETVRVLRVLLRKAQRPSNYTWQVRRLQAATKDFRVLGSVAAALPGHTREGGYPLLSSFTGFVAQVHEEATLDQLATSLARVAATCKRPLDRRLLALASAVVEGRASRVAEAEQGHARRALADLQAAFHEDWQPGERTLMAGFLRSLGKVHDEAVRREQLAELDALRQAEEPGSLERLAVAHDLALTLWAYGDTARALAVLGAALDATRQAHDGVVPLAAVRTFDTQVNWLASLQHFREAEALLVGERARWSLPLRRRGLTRRLLQLRVDALGHGASVSLGRGQALFEATLALLERAAEAEPAAASPLVSLVCRLHENAQARGTPRDAGDRLETWGRTWLPTLLARVPLDAAAQIQVVARSVHKLDGAPRAIGFVLDRADAEPTWLARIGRDAWRRSAWDVARWRKEAGALGPLEPRLLARVLAQLESDLRSGSWRANWFWNLGQKWAWPEHEQDYADTAARVAELEEGSEAIVVRCASLLRSPLKRHAQAIDMLTAAQQRGLLHERSRWTLVRWLTQDGAFGRALPLVQALVAERPDTLSYRTQLAEVLAGLGRKPQALAALQDAEKRLRSQKRWNVSSAGTLGAAAVARGFGAQAETWLRDALQMRRAQRGTKSGADSTLSTLYRQLARACGLQGHTEPAIQAAADAILTANPRSHSQMRGAVSALTSAVRGADDLAAWIRTYDARVARSGMDAPLLRKAFAAVFRERKHDRDAVVQLRLARDLDPADGDVHRRLVAAYDRLGDAQAAIDALFGSIRLAPHALGAYPDLAARFAKAGQAAQAERALTTLAEMAPHQPAGHRALAQAWEARQRFADAAVQWHQVVRTDRLDPTGWLGWARSLVRVHDEAGARKALEHVLHETWEARFGDVKKKAAALLAGLHP